MKRIIIIAIILVSFISSSVAMANIYTWTDKKGLRHFSNQSPPSGADVFIEESASAPISNPVEGVKVENNNSPAENKEIDDNLNDRQDKSLEAPKQGDPLKYNIRSTDYTQKLLAEPDAYGYGKSLNRRSYVTVEDTPSEDDYDDPVDNIHRTDMTNLSGYDRHHRDRDRYRRHTTHYRYSENPYRGYSSRHRNYNAYRYGRHNARDHHYTNRHYVRQHRRHQNHNRMYRQNQRHQGRSHYYGSNHHRGRRLGMHYQQRY